jgi:hypothetical protein
LQADEMALFFDQDWFDAKLKGLGLTRDDAAAALHLMRTEIDEIWKDQREISAKDVSILSMLLKVPADEIVVRAGVATPAPASGGDGDRSAVLSKLEVIEQRLARMERAIAELQSMMIATRPLG